MVARTDETLVAAARRGERWAEEELFGLVRAFARHVCGKSAGASLPEVDWEDVAQEAGRRFFAVGLDRFKLGGPVKIYVYAFVRSAYLQMQRSAWRRRRREDAAAPAIDEPGQAADPETRTLLHGILKRLSAECRELLGQLYFDGATYAELAAGLGLADSSLRARTSRCLKKARDIVS